MDMSFPPDGVGGGFCPCSKVLIPEFSGAPSRDPGVGLCSISPMMEADYLESAGSHEKEKHIRRGDSFKAPEPHLPSSLRHRGAPPTHTGVGLTRGEAQHIC